MWNKIDCCINQLPGEIWGRLEVGWEKVACWSTKVATSLKRVKTDEKLLWRAYRKSSTLFRFCGWPPYFYFRFRLYGHRGGRFCLIFACTAQQSVQDGTNGLSSFKPCAYCRIVHRADIFAIAQLSCCLWRCTMQDVMRNFSSLVFAVWLCTISGVSCTAEDVRRGGRSGICCPVIDGQKYRHAITSGSTTGFVLIKQ